MKRCNRVVCGRLGAGTWISCRCSGPRHGTAASTAAAWHRFTLGICNRQRVAARRRWRDGDAVIRAGRAPPPRRLPAQSGRVASSFSGIRFPRLSVRIFRAYVGTLCVLCLGAHMAGGIRDAHQCLGQYPALVFHGYRHRLLGCTIGWYLSTLLGSANVARVQQFISGLCCVTSSITFTLDPAFFLVFMLL